MIIRNMFHQQILKRIGSGSSDHLKAYHDRFYLINRSLHLEVNLVGVVEVIKGRKKNCRKLTTTSGIRLVAGKVSLTWLKDKNILNPPPQNLLRAPPH